MGVLFAQALLWQTELRTSLISGPCQLWSMASGDTNREGEQRENGGERRRQRRRTEGIVGPS